MKQLVAYLRTNGHCAYCGKQLDPERFHTDHIVAKKRGGGNRGDNLIAACTTCNSNKRDKSIEEFRLWHRTTITSKLAPILSIVNKSWWLSDSDKSTIGDLVNGICRQVDERAINFLIDGIIEDGEHGRP
jgi:hypothetical protein